MDIWSWVWEAERELRSAGQVRLADIVDQVPHLVSESHHEQVEALVPEGVALARAIDHPWVEIFLRHWLAQSRIFYRNDVTHGMDELVRLLDFAHGERTSSCPQSVCVTQDFCGAYGALDGPGFGEERLAASAEALARIDVSWPCFSCISQEHADALFDLDRNAEAEAFCRKQIEAAIIGGQYVYDLPTKRATALTNLGRLEEAATLLESYDTSQRQASTRRRHALAKTRTYALLGRLDDALAARLDPDSIEPVEFVRWMQGEEALCALRPERNDAGLGLTLRQFCETLREHGALFQQGEVAAGAARLALARGRPVLATLHLDVLEALLPKLRKPAGLERELKSLREKVSPPACERSAEQVLEALSGDAETDLESLLAAAAAHPASEAIALATARVCNQLGFPLLGRRRLQECLAAHPDSTHAFDELLRALVRTNDEAALGDFAAKATGEQRAKVYFYLGRLYVRTARWADAAKSFERVRELDPGNRDADSNLAYAYRHLDRNEEALALLDDLATSETDTSDDWDRMIVATLLGRHEKVRDSAARLGFNFEGEGPIDEPFAYCEVKLRDDVGRETQYRCLRINPVVGRIIAMQGPDKPCRYRDEILFDPVALNPRPPAAESSTEEEADYVPVFRAIKMLKPGGFRIYDIDGVHPGEDALSALGAALTAANIVMSVRSGDNYQLAVKEGESTVTGVYIFAAVPESVPAEALYRVLRETLQGWREPVTYRGLLRELGREQELEEQERIAQQLKL